MNKVHAVSLALLAIASVSSTNVNAAATGGSTTATVLTVTGPATSGGGTADCQSLKAGEQAIINLSANNYAAVNCPDASTAKVGVANAKGKGKRYSANSVGGAVTETIDATVVDAGTAQSAASTAAGGS